MIVLRSLAALAGLTVLLFAPHFAAEFATSVRGAGLAPSTVAAIAMLGVLLMSAGFFVVALAGPAELRRPALRTTAAILLALPVLASTLALLLAPRISVLALAAPLLGVSALAFGAFIWPGAPRRRRRYNRPREPFVHAAILPK